MIEKRQTELFCEWLDNYLDYERIKKKGEFSLVTMKYLVERFRHPERSFKSIHVAGSKGKGSVTTMIASILGAQGIVSGIYTSPHLLDFTERISTTSGLLSDAEYGKACDIVVPLVDSIIPGSIPGGLEPSWFELVTLFAFVAFRESGLSWAVVETGLGGRLDATNVLMPEACVLTPIELEHTEYLGDTIAKIAGEKAGIMKEGVPTFVSGQRSEARASFEERARALRAPLFSMEDAIASLDTSLSKDGLSVTINFRDLEGGARFSRPISARLSLLGAVQAQNAALSAYTAKFLFPDCPEETIERGLSRAWLPGRFEIARRDPPLILDGAHTIRSVALTLETFAALYPGDAHLLFACAADKAVDDMAALFRKRFSRITVTRPGEKKQSDIAHAERAFASAFGGLAGRGDCEVTINGDFSQAIAKAIDEARYRNVPLLVTGSFYLVAEAKKILDLRREDQES